ncbi:MAG: hypothetical protein QW197_01565 [Candidatus Aenigmatarchaeota archaeon]
MHPLVKAFLGIVIAVAAIYYIFKGVPFLSLKPALSDVITVLNGGIPVMLVFLGLFIAWLYYDEWKIEKELQRELQKESEKTEEAKKERKKKK